MMNTNVRAPLLLVQALIPYLPSHSGRIINMYVLVPLISFPPPSLSKGQVLPVHGYRQPQASPLLQYPLIE